MAVSERRRKGCGPVHEQLSGPVVRMRHAVRSASIRQKRSQGMQSRTCDKCDDATARHIKTRQRARGTARDPTLRRLFRRAVAHYELAGGASMSLVSLWGAKSVQGFS